MIPLKIASITSFLGFTSKKEQPGTPSFSPETAGEKVVLMEWLSEARPETRGLSKRLTRTFTIIGVVLGLLLIIMQEYFLILVVASMIFISNAISKAPAEKVRIQVSTHGVSYGDTFYYWNELKRFFFYEGGKMAVVAVDTRESLPGRLFLSYAPESKEKIKEILSQHLQYLEKEPATFFDKAYTSVIDKLAKED